MTSLLGCLVLTTDYPATFWTTFEIVVYKQKKP